MPAPQTAEVIVGELHESLVECNLEGKLLTMTIDKCASNDKAIKLTMDKIRKIKLILEAIILHMSCYAHI